MGFFREFRNCSKRLQLTKVFDLKGFDFSEWRQKRVNQNSESHDSNGGNPTKNKNMN